MTSPNLHVFALDIIVFRQMSTAVVHVSVMTGFAIVKAPPNNFDSFLNTFFHNELFVKPKAI